MGLARRIKGFFFGDMIPQEKYDYLLEKYNALKREFRNYRDEANMRERRLKREIKQMKEKQDINNEILELILPHVQLTARDKAKILELEVAKSKTIFH